MTTDRMIRKLVEATNRIDGSYYLASRRLGCPENEVCFLYALSDGEKYSQKQISQEWLMLKTTVNTVFRSLEDRGLVTSETNGKEKMIILTEKGKEYSEKLLSPIREAEKVALKKTLESYSAVFIDACSYFADRLEEELKENKYEKH